MPEHFDVTNLRYKDPNFVQILKLWAVDTDPYPPETKRLKDKFERDMSRDPDKLLGYELKKFSNLAKNIDGIQPGFYVVGAETNAGKTAFLCNMTLDLLDSNEGLTGIYFSLNDSWDVILNRFLSIRTGIPLNLVQRPQKKHRHEEMLKDGYNYLTELMTENRLFIRDSSDIENIMDLEIEIRRKMNRKLFVVIDSLYNLEMNLDGGDPRRENIERANRLKALSNTYGIPLVCTGELRKSRDRRDGNKPPIFDDLMETGKFAYNANLALLLYPESWDVYDQDDEPILIMKYAKNKLSHFRGETVLKFNRATSRLFENEKGQELIQTIPV
jgi:replicative DNA helicase